MRSKYIKWLVLCLTVIVVLVIISNKHHDALVDQHDSKAHMAVVEAAGMLETDKDHSGSDNSINGLFKEDRKIPQVFKEFKADSFEQKKNAGLNYKAELQSLIDKKVPADNPDLVRIIRNYYIQQPSTEPYNLLNPERIEFSNGQTPFIDSRLNYMEGGFYVECGGLNGEKGSNSLFFERVRKWNGLLIEADPSNYAELKKKNRKAFSVNACLSPRSTAAVLNFNKAFNMGRAIHNEEAERWMRAARMKKDYVQIECFPLYSLMLALNRTTIDFFSLDVEGDELNVLKTIPFDKLNIKMLTVEYAHGGAGGRDIQSFLQGKGYDVMLKVSRDDWGVNDLIFRKKELKH